MGKYIDKDALVVKMENRIKKLQNLLEGNEKLDSIQKTAILLCIDECKVILSFLNTLEVKEVNLEDEVDKNDYRKLFEDSTKLNIDSTTEIKFDESTKFKWDDYIKMKEEEKTITSKFYKRLFKNIPTVSMKIFSWWNRNKRKENKI